MTAQCIDCQNIWSISKHADNHMYVCPHCTSKRKAKKRSSQSLAGDKRAKQHKPAYNNKQFKNIKKKKKRKGVAI